jgi:hypothetical protein
MESTNQLVTISKLFGLMTCVSLAFIFPLFAYETNSGVIFDAFVSTTVGTVIISLVLK